MFIKDFVIEESKKYGESFIRNMIESAVIKSRIEYDYAYRESNAIVKYLVKLNPKKMQKYIVNNTRESLVISSNVPIIFRIDKSNLLIVICEEKKYMNGNGRKKLSLYFIGKNSVEYKEKLLKNALVYYDYIERKTGEDEARVVIETINKQGRKFTNAIDKKYFNSIIMDDEDKKKLIDNLNVWKRSGNYYYKHQIISKIGILLYGESGTGKSSLIKAIASKLGRGVVLINVDNLDIINFSEFYGYIIAIEDIDLFFKDRDSNSEKRNNSLHTLFQILDGMGTTANQVVIATTNHIEKLDEALVRAGRFDIKIEMKNFDRKKAEEMCSILGFNPKVLDKLNITYPIKPAELQAKLMDYRTKVLVERESKKNNLKNLDNVLEFNYTPAHRNNYRDTLDDINTGSSSMN